MDDQPNNKRRSERTESGLTAIKEARLLEMATRENWSRASRWETRVDDADLIDRIKHKGKLSIAERTELAVVQLLQSQDERVKVQAARCALNMEAQNQRDELAALKAGGAGDLPGSVASTPADQVASMDDTIPQSEAS